MKHILFSLTAAISLLFASCATSDNGSNNQLLQIAAQTAVELAILDKQESDPAKINHMIALAIPVLRGEEINLDLIENPKYRILAKNLFAAYLAQGTGLGEAQLWATELANALELIQGSK